jgi:large subunit ribosomal protein L2
MNFNKYKNIQKQYDVEFAKVKYRKNLKRLLLNKPKSLGRSQGTIVSWHRGGGVKRNFRPIFDYQNKITGYALIRSIEYDPNRSAFIGLAQTQQGAFINIIISSLLKVGDVISLDNSSFSYTKNGDFLKLRQAPIGIPIYNLEKFPGSGPIYSKAAGVYSTLLTKDLNYGKVKLPSGEERLFDLNCSTTLGVPSNINNKFNKKYKAGTTRLLNKRPIVRGVAMNPVDHPHGGGQGKTKGGRPSVSPWGKLTKGVPTRSKSLKNKFIVKRS